MLLFELAYSLYGDTRYSSRQTQLDAYEERFGIGYSMYHGAVIHVLAGTPCGLALLDIYDRRDAGTTSQQERFRNKPPEPFHDFSVGR